MGTEGILPLVAEIGLAILNIIQLLLLAWVNKKLGETRRNLRDVALIARNAAHVNNEGQT